MTTIDLIGKIGSSEEILELINLDLDCNKMETKRKIIIVTETCSESEFPYTLKSLYQWISDKLNKIRLAGCKGDPVVRLESEGSYSPVLTIIYKRPETDNELEKRISDIEKAKKYRLHKKKLNEIS